MNVPDSKDAFERVRQGWSDPTDAYLQGYTDALEEAAKDFGPGQITGTFGSTFAYVRAWLGERKSQVEAGW